MGFLVLIRGMGFGVWVSALRLEVCGLRFGFGDWSLGLELRGRGLGLRLG